jgi:hypothetical protein
MFILEEHCLRNVAPSQMTSVGMRWHFFLHHLLLLSECHWPQTSLKPHLRLRSEQRNCHSPLWSYRCWSRKDEHRSLFRYIVSTYLYSKICDKTDFSALRILLSVTKNSHSVCKEGTSMRWCLWTRKSISLSSYKCPCFWTFWFVSEIHHRFYFHNHTYLDVWSGIMGLCQ